MFNAPKSTVNLNYRNNEGYTPLHMACLSDKPECVAALLLAGADPNACVNMSKAQKTPTNVADFFKGKTNNNKLCKEDMKYGGTPLHWCCSRETLNALIMSGCDVNATNFKGRTALHDMVERNRLECVVSLLAHEAEVDRLDNDLKSPLHIAIEKRLLNMVQCLVVFGANLNLANKDGMTPRHMAAQEGVSGLHVILYILHSVGAKRCGKNVSSCSAGCSFDGDFNGIPPEAPEMAENREHIENMLASTSRQVFTQGALDFLEDASRPDTTIINTDSEKKGQSMMDALLAMFTTKVYADSKANTPTGSTTGKLASGASSPQKSASSSASTPTGDGPVVGVAATTASGKDANYPHGRGRVLCLDGGGIRGLVLAQMLMEIENMAQVPIVHLFDWIAGTSTGGILALGIGSGMSVRQLIGLYMRMKEQCFVGSRPYNSELFENILKENLGEMAVMTDIKNTKVMVTAVMADRKPVDLHLFRNYTSASDILGIVTPINNRRQPPPRPEEQLVWRAARASGAAPSYFRAFGRFLDGGLVANNPTLDALTEIHEYNMALRSVGRDSEAVPRVFGGETLPNNRVIEIRSESLGTLQILARDEAMVLFAPAYNTNDKKGQYDIVLQRPTSESTNLSFSLYRTTNLKEAEDRFNAFLNRLPQFVSIVKEFYNIQGLQKVCDILAENPSWSLTHLVAYFNLTDYVNNPKVLQCIDYPDHVNFMSPLQLAIRCGNLEMVKALLPLSKIDHLDSSNQSVFHYAANSNKEIINLLAPKSTVNLNYRNNEGYTPLHMACLSDKPECVAALLLAGADPNACVNMSKAQKTPTNVADFFKGKTNNNKLCKEDMKYGGTPLHWCCSRETLNALIMSGCDVNATNFKGRTALHDMVERNRLECVVSLLAHEAEVDRLDNDLKSPLHIAIEKRLLNMVQCLVVFGANLNLANKDGMTPRHMAAQEGVSGLHVILYILHSVGAKRCGKNVSSCSAGCSFDGDFNGIPPEAPEMAENREHIENMLASTSRQVFTQGALDFLEDASRPDTTIINTDSEKKGQSMMDALLAMFTTKVYADSKANTPTGSTTGKLASGASSPQKSASSSASTPTGDGPVVGAAATTASGKDANYPHGRGRVLCLDGGGIRGLVLAQMLMEIENMAQVPIVHLFDWIAGTSTGGILALGIGSGISVRQLIGLYMRMKEQCFVGSRPYNSELFENILKENLGEMAVMTDIKNTKVMVTAVMADRKPVDLHLFRNYTSASDILGIVTPINNRRQPPPRPEEQLVWRAARASGAAPSYFRAFGRFLDGGLVANNPTLDALTEIHEYNMALRSVGRDSEAVPVSIVVSLGTGMIPVSELTNIDVYRPESLWDVHKVAYGLSSMYTLLVDQATASDGRVVDRARAWCSLMGVPYQRLNPQLSEEIALDEKEDKKLINMLWETKAYIYENRSKIHEMIYRLKNPPSNKL